MELTARQLDGFVCIMCGSEKHAQVPVGLGPHGQLFECSRHHRVVTVERQGGYAARCTVIVDGVEHLCGITFGGFRTRTEARAALVHEKTPAAAATANEGEIPTKGIN